MSYSRTAYRRTTIGAAAFHCRVRNGNGWGHCAIITRVRCRTGRFAALAARQADADLWGRWRLTQTPYNLSWKEHDFQSVIANRKFVWFSDIYIQEGSAGVSPVSTSHSDVATGKLQLSSFVFFFEIIRLFC
jgi:hypothetical protein